MSRRPAAIAALASVLLVLGPSSSDAHDVVTTTSLTRFKVPGGTTQRGTNVVLLGKLRSNDLSCRDGLSVGLYRQDSTGDHLVARDVTDSEGEYVFQRRPRRDQTMIVRFAGLVQSSPDHSHDCGASASKEIRLRVSR
ncbi:MAG: hypothetical protein ACRDH9_01360 [Actinomycetota bacterium]